MSNPIRTTVAFAKHDASPPLEVILPDGTAPTPLGSGTISSILGEGGASIVYEIWNDQLGVKRAVKLLRPNALPTWRERFATEIRITAQLRHPNIIEIHSVGEWNRLPYIEMERLDGCSLDKLLAQRGALPLRVALAIGIMVSRALSYTHAHTYTVNGQPVKGILHRDLKPANIMIAENGMVKLMDFGLATPVNISMHTMEGTFVGSLPYMSPELLEGRKASTGTDTYAFGAVMYEMLTGVPAFAETNISEFMAKRMRNEYRPLREFRRRLPGRLVKLMARCMAFDSDKRISSAAQVCETLERIYAQLTVLKPEECVHSFLTNSSPRRSVALRRRPVALSIAVAAVVAAAVLILGYAGWMRRDALPRLKAAPAPVQQPQPAAVPAETVFIAQPPPASAAPAAGPAYRRERAAPARASPAVRTPQPAPAPAPDVKPPSLIAQLAKAYGTADPAAILVLAVRAKDYQNALRVYDSLSPGGRKGAQAVLCKLRALEGLGDRAALIGFADQNPLPDAEYFLITARAMYAQRRYGEALALIAKSRTSAAEFADPGMIERDALYYRAQCLTAQYQSAPTEENRTAASDAWIEVKYALRNDQNHRYFTAANDHIRRLNPEEGEGR